MPLKTREGDPPAPQDSSADTLEILKGDTPTPEESKAGSRAGGATSVDSILGRLFNAVAHER